MSKYTTEIRWLCESIVSKEDVRIPEGVKGIDTIISISAPKIFNFDFPIFDENYRMVLETKILRHFYTREICEETVELWKLRLWDKLNIIMPYYNQLYLSELFKFNPLYDVDLTRDHTGNSEGVSNTVENTNSERIENENKNKVDVQNGNRSNVSDSNATSTENMSDSENNNAHRVNDSTLGDTGTNWTLFSDTPQGGVNLMDGGDPNVDNKAYLTNATKNTISDSKVGHEAEDNTETKNRVADNVKNDVNHLSSNENIDSTNSSNEVNVNNENSNVNKNVNNVINNTDNYVEHIVGKQGSHTYSAMLIEFRKTLLNIDAMVLRDLEELFFGLWE